MTGRRRRASEFDGVGRVRVESKILTTEPVVAGSVGRELVSFALPVLGASVLQLLDGSVNAIWVGRYLGDAALAGVSNDNTVLLFLFAGAFGVWTALTVRIGTHLGAGSIQDAKRVVRTAGIVFAGAVGLLVVPLLIFAEPVLKVLDVPADSLRQGVEYLRVILFSVPITYVYETAVAVLRGAGDTKTAFYFLLLSVAIDAGLNPVFIFGVGPVSGRGVAGSAFATLLGQAAGIIALLAFLYRRRHPLCLRWGDLRIRRGDLRVAGELVKLGGPMGVEFLSGSVLAVLMFSLVNRFGSDVTAAYGAAIQLWNYVMIPSVAVSMAATSMAAQSIGAKRWDRVRTIARLGVVYSILSTAVLLVVLEGLDRRAFALFLPAGAPALAIASEINREASWSCIFFALYAALMGAPRAAGAVCTPLAISAVALGVRFLIADALLGCWQAQGIWWSFPASGVVAGIGAALYYRRGQWRRR